MTLRPRADGSTTPVPADGAGTVADRGPARIPLLALRLPRLCLVRRRDRRRDLLGVLGIAVGARGGRGLRPDRAELRHRPRRPIVGERLGGSLVAPAGV